MSTDCSCPGLRDMIARLIAQDTVSSRGHADLDRSNRPVIDLVASWTEACGFGTRILDLPHKPGKHNLVATLGSGPGGLVLAGHADTVPWDAERWTFDPFTATERDGRLYGLGSCDMKSYLALAVEAARRYAGRHPARPLHIVVTADEECDMAGARSLAETEPLRADAAVIGEPTNLLPVRMHKGIFMERLRLVGRSGHSSDPAYGNNALEGMHTAIAALLAHREELQASQRNESFRVPTPTLNLGQIRGGDNPNRICGECELSFDLRLLPGMDRSTCGCCPAWTSTPSGSGCASACAVRSRGPGWRSDSSRCSRAHRPPRRPRTPRSCGPPRHSRDMRPAPWPSVPRPDSSSAWAWTCSSWGRAASRRPTSPTSTSRSGNSSPPSACWAN